MCDACDKNWVRGLPPLLEVKDLVVRCRGCRRAWQLPADGHVSTPNFHYLCDHALDHLRTLKKRPRQTWRNRKPQQTVITTPGGIEISRGLDGQAEPPMRGG